MGGEEEWSAAMRYLPCGVLCCGGEPEDRILSVNPGFLDMFGYTRQELFALRDDRFFELVCPEDREILRRGGDELEYRARRRDGSFLQVLDRNRVVAEGDGSRRHYRVLMDITRRIREEEAARLAAERREAKLLELARRDALTDLYNNKAVRVQAEALMAAWEPGTLQALMIIDLDDFKGINDCYGHLCGDAVLTDLAACLKALLRTTDSVGRIGGDEFLAYLPCLRDRATAKKKAWAILEALSKIPLREESKRGISCSIGIAFYPDHGMDYASLYRCADMALYRAKSRGKRGCAVYGEEG